MPITYRRGPYHNPTSSEKAGGKPRPMWVQSVLAVSALLIAGIVLLAPLEIRFMTVQGPYPENAVHEFCQALIAKDYATAWDHVDHAAFGEEDQFLQANSARDAQIGPVSDCVVLGRNFFATFGDSDAAFEVAVTLPDGRHQGTVMLHNIHGGWFITYLASDLSLRL